MRDLIVLIPGIMGSTLTKNGKAIWAPTPEAPLQALTSGLDDLNLTEDPLDQEELPGIEAPSLVRVPHLVPDFWKIDAYTTIAATIKTRFSVKQSENYIEFPYDWRRDNRVSAKRLQHLSNDWLRRWRAHSGNKDAKLILICHSMGGLVARYFLEVLGGWRNTRTLITFGTPFRGAMKALNYVANGAGYTFVPFRDRFWHLMLSFTSVYQLLPYYKCCQTDLHSDFDRVSSLRGIATLDSAKVASAMGFHDSIRNAVETNNKQKEYSNLAHSNSSPYAYKIALIVGTQQPTQVYGQFDSKRFAAIEEIGDDGGDGTVPRGAAIPWELEFNSGEFYVAEQHSSLMSNAAALNHLTGVLTGMSLSTLRGFGPEDQVPKSLSLRVQDAYQSARPIEIEIEPSKSAQVIDLKVDLGQAGGLKKIKLKTLARKDTVYHATFEPAPPGVYKLTVSSSKGNSSVSDLFAVF